jgi:hypothetical protein
MLTEKEDKFIPKVINYYDEPRKNTSLSQKGSDANLSRD